MTQTAADGTKTVYVWYPARFGSWETSSIEWDAITHICFHPNMSRAQATEPAPHGFSQAVLDEVSVPAGFVLYVGCAPIGCDVTTTLPGPCA